MGSNRHSSADTGGALDRRELLAYTAAFGTAFLAGQGLVKADEPASKPAAPLDPKSAGRYPMKKSINLWAFPYPQKMSLEECFELAKRAGFDAVEINFAPGRRVLGRIETGRDRSHRQAGAARGNCHQRRLLVSVLALLADAERSRAAQTRLELARQMIEAAKILGTENLLVVPGAVYIPWLEGAEPVPNDVCDKRAREAISQLVPVAEKAGVCLNMENIFANGYLFSPQEMIEFVDSFKSPWVKVHFDTGNIMQYQFPEHWVRHAGRAASRTSTSRNGTSARTSSTCTRFAPCSTAPPTGRP